MSFRFEWHEKKAVENHRKHRVTFQEALTVFADLLAAIFEDPGHPTGEQREIVVGRSERGRLLLVAFTERAPDTVRLKGLFTYISRTRRRIHFAQG